MHCAGFTSDTYDRYVLGLLEEPDRSQLESQIQQQCPACLTGVQRSMNLWLVFAETLENAAFRRLSRTDCTHRRA